MCLCRVCLFLWQTAKCSLKILILLQDGPVLKKAHVVPKSRKDSHSGSSNDVKKIPVKNRMERWKATGVVALSESNLEVIIVLSYIQLHAWFCVKWKIRDEERGKFYSMAWY